MRHALAGLALACGAGLLVTACSAASTQSAASARESSAPAQTPTSGPTTPTPTPAATGASVTVAATGTVTDSDGDKVSFTVSTGQPEPLSSTSDQIAHACDTALQSQNSLPSSAVVYPVSLTWTLESSVPATITMDYQPYYMVSAASSGVTNGVYSAGPTDLDGYQQSGNANGDSCLTDGGPGGGSGVTWQNEAQDATGTLSGYLIVEGVITPDNPTGLTNDPAGKSDSAGPILIQPLFSINNNDSEVDNTYSYESASSPNLVQCSGSSGGQPGTYIALDPKDAIANGCTK